jgi:hypothetical protein
MARSRASWRARPHRELTRDGAKHTMVIHHSAGSGLDIDTLDEQARALRSIQRFHMDENGWADIGYPIVVFQPRGHVRKPQVWWARPLWAVPAAQLNANSGTIPVCVVANNEPIMDATYRRLLTIAENLKANHEITRLKGHFQLTATSCPVPRLTALLPRLRAETGLRG